MMIVAFFLLIGGLFAPAIAVMPWTFRLLRKESKLFVFLISFPAGWALFTLALFMMNLLTGIKLNLMSGLFVLATIFIPALLFSILSGLNLKRNSIMNIKSSSNAKPFKKLTLIVLLIISLFFWGIIGFYALSSPVECIPGFGVWGYKSLLIYDTGIFPFDAILDRGRPYLHPGYPPGYPLLLAWCHFCIGEFNDHLIKFIPFFCAILFYLLFLNICIQLGIGLNQAVFFALLAASSGTFILCATTMYAELILLLYVLSGLFLLTRALEDNEGNDFRYAFSAMLLLAMSAWIKSEGIIYFFTAAISLVLNSIYSERKNLIPNKCFFIALLLPLLLFILPWAICRIVFRLNNVDFNLAKPFLNGIEQCFNGLRIAFIRILEHMFINMKASGGVWIFILFGLIKAIIEKRSDRKTIFIYCFLTAVVFSFAAIFFFSVRPIRWHVEALPRLLLIPSCSILPFAIQILLDVKKRPDSAV